MNHVTNKQGYGRWYIVQHKRGRDLASKRIFAESALQAWSRFIELYGHEAPSTERTDYIIL